MTDSCISDSNSLNRLNPAVPLDNLFKLFEISKRAIFLNETDLGQEPTFYETSVEDSLLVIPKPTITMLPPSTIVNLQRKCQIGCHFWPEESVFMWLSLQCFHKGSFFKIEVFFLQTLRSVFKWSFPPGFVPGGQNNETISSNPDEYVERISLHMLSPEN